MKKSRSKRTLKQARSLSDALLPRERIREALREQMHAAMLGLMKNLFQQEVQALCGPRYKRDRQAVASRAGSEVGSVYWDGKRQTVRRPRVRVGSHEVNLESYPALRDYDALSEEVQQLLLRGISTRDYSEVLKKLDEDLPLSKSSASRAFTRASQKDLDLINGRDLGGETDCCIMIDGIEKAGVHAVVAMGFTTKGHKRLLGLREGATENTVLVKDLLQSMIDRNLTSTQYVLFVLDGAKALRRAVNAHWGHRAVIQRCQEHKIRNVIGYLPKAHQAAIERALRAAYGMETYELAKQALDKLLTRLKELNSGAAKSLSEGLEETLTVHRLGLPDILRKTFRSTNPIESIFDKVKTRGRRVKNWQANNQFARWAASSLLLHEKKFRKIKEHKQLHVLLTALENQDIDQAKKVS